MLMPQMTTMVKDRFATAKPPSLSRTAEFRGIDVS
jgi:hypothetical protein